MRNKAVTYHLNTAEGSRWLSQPAVRPKFISHFEGASSATSSLLHCVVEYVPVAFDPTDLESVESVETANNLGAKTIQFAKWFKQPERRSAGQPTAFMLMGFLTREAANLAIANSLVIRGRICLVRKLLPEPRRCLRCQKWDPGHLAAGCKAPVDVCARCTGPHRTSTCAASDYETKCSNCPVQEENELRRHGAGDRTCPIFMAKVEAMHQRTPGAHYRFFPTNDPATW
ncbi:hypothetical protein HYPSUDRAFT_145416, partial [Hypholoma sublateritium FD-334 SS-4]